MRIIGASVKFSRQINGGQSQRKAPGFYSEREAAAPITEHESLGECVQRAFAEVKKRVCDDIQLPPNHELK
jgi:hypothetical protein